jgi:hypothetical protein
MTLGSWCTPGPPDETPERPGQIAPPAIMALCGRGWRPIFITGLLRDLLVRHFQTPLNVEEFDLRKFLWKEDTRTGILIESIHRWRGDLVEKRPAIILKRNDMQNVRWGIGDLCGETEDGFYEFCTGWVGSHTVFCIHGSGASAEILATEVMREIHQFHPVITQYLGLLRWGVTSYGAISEVEEARESFVVPITVGWAYQDTWRLELESMKLRRVALSTLLRA